MAAESLPEVTVYKSPTCGCCNAWVEHMRQSGFRVDVKEAALRGGDNHAPAIRPGSSNTPDVKACRVMMPLLTSRGNAVTCSVTK